MYSKWALEESLLADVVIALPIYKYEPWHLYFPYPGLSLARCSEDWLLGAFNYDSSWHIVYRTHTKKMFLAPIKQIRRENALNIPLPSGKGNSSKSEMHFNTALQNSLRSLSWKISCLVQQAEKIQYTVALLPCCLGWVKSVVCVKLARLTAVADTVRSAEWAYAQGELDSLNTGVVKHLRSLNCNSWYRGFPFSKCCVFPIEQGGGQLHIQTPNLQHYSAGKMWLFPSSSEQTELLPRLVQPAVILQGCWTPVHMRFGAVGVRSKTFPYCSGYGSSRDPPMPLLLFALHPSGRKVNSHLKSWVWVEDGTSERTLLAVLMAVCLSAPGIHRCVEEITYHLKARTNLPLKHCNPKLDLLCIWAIFVSRSISAPKDKSAVPQGKAPDLAELHKIHKMWKTSFPSEGTWVAIKKKKCL